ncbi:uncharacterized protein LOC110739816 [Chenopodium quinoa]|uniref:uncharacterized protein LOC110739816 n=1 Tax=Chenopodium quinoa TaxID=63459 RepID=UPI000B78130A|nr:uncharacterized protein LOC110739816 [Chenopodium quinoa]
MKRRERSWMYDRLDGRSIKPEFLKGVEEFIQFCEDHRETTKNEYRCPCVKCNNRRFQDPDTVRIHLYSKGFTPRYWEWMCQGEGLPESSVEGKSNEYRDMVMDDVGHNYDRSGTEEEEPNAEAKRFLDLLKASEHPLYEGSSMSVLEVAARITSLKCEYNLPHRCVDGFVSLLTEAIPGNSRLGETFYDVKKVVKGLELPHEKIHACPKGCMLFWKEDVELPTCRVCGSDRYKRTFKGSLVPKNALFYFPITSRLQRMFATKNISEEMSWHANNPRVKGTMAHPSDTEAWRQLDTCFPEFPSDPRNVQLGLCTDGFAPHGKLGVNTLVGP